MIHVGIRAIVNVSIRVKFRFKLSFRVLAGGVVTIWIRSRDVIFELKLILL